MRLIAIMGSPHGMKGSTGKVLTSLLVHVHTNTMTY